MFDIWIADTSLTAGMLAVSSVAVLPLQVLLCFKVKSRRLRLMPVVILFLAAAANVVMIFVVSGWKRRIFAACAMYILLMVFVCGVGWAIWAIIKRRGGSP